MDILPEETDPAPPTELLSYDNDIAYEDQLPPHPSLADRISANKVYLLSDTVPTRTGKVGKSMAPDELSK